MFAHHADLTRDFHGFLMVCALVQCFGAWRGGHRAATAAPGGA
jgi:hypothetical protein